MYNECKKVCFEENFLVRNVGIMMPVHSCERIDLYVLTTMWESGMIAFCSDQRKTASEGMHDLPNTLIATRDAFCQFLMALEGRNSVWTPRNQTRGLRLAGLSRSKDPNEPQQLFKISGRLILDAILHN